VISESKRIGIDTGSLDMSEPTQRAALVDAIRVEWCAGLDASACVVTVVEPGRMRSRRLAPAELDVERSYDLTMSQGLSQLNTSGLQSANVTVTSETLTGLAVTSTITQQGNSASSSLDDNFPSPDALTNRFSAQIPSVSFSVSAPTVITPPMPPPRAPPAPPAVDRRRKHRDDTLVIALVVGVMGSLVIALLIAKSFLAYRRKLAKVAVAPMATISQPDEGTRSRMRMTPTPNPSAAAAGAASAYRGMLAARQAVEQAPIASRGVARAAEETSAQVAASVVGEAAGAVALENTQPPAAEVPRLPLHLQSDWQSGPPETADAAGPPAGQPPADQPPAGQPPAAPPPAATPTAEDATSPSPPPSSVASHRPAPSAPGWAAPRRRATSRGRILQ